VNLLGLEAALQKETPTRAEIGRGNKRPLAKASAISLLQDAPPVDIRPLYSARFYPELAEFSSDPGWAVTLFASSTDQDLRET
jgi:hypothetical protein